MGVFQALYNSCKRREVANTELFGDFREWVENPMTWRLLGDRALEMEEELIARECYRCYVDRVNEFRRKKDLEALNIEILMKIAKNCASK